jgi:peptide/nickel transport system permease protein
MLTAIVRRILLSGLILFLVAAFVFIGTEVLPGDALDVYLTDEDVSVMTLDQIEALRRELGLDQPAAVRFLR